MSFDQQLDFAKLCCQLHPYEVVTNYCNDEQCLIGLCATCVCNHTQVHANMGTVPRYQNIRDTYCSLRDQVRNQIKIFGEDKSKLGNVRENAETKKKNIRKIIRQLKEETVSKVKEEFDSLERKILADIRAQDKKQGYHSSIRFDTLQKNLMRETETLLKFSENLNSPNFLQIANKLKKSQLTEFVKNRLKLQKQLEDNETYTAHLKWNKSFPSEIESTIRKIFTLQFVIPKISGEVRNCILPFKQNGLKINTIIRSNSQPKLCYSLTKNNSLNALSRLSETSYGNFLIEEDKNVLMPMKRQTFLKRSSLNTTVATDGGFMRGKQNNMNRSCLIGDYEADSKSIMMNNSQLISPSCYPCDKLSYLIEAKRNCQFDNPSIAFISREPLGNSRM